MTVAGRSGAAEDARAPFDTTDPAAYEAVVGDRIDAPVAAATLEALGDLTRVEMALDTRCRAGRTVQRLIEELGSTARVIGIDPDPGLLELARRRVYESLGRRAFIKGDDVEHLSFGDGVFDLCLAPRALEGAGPHTALAEIARVTAPGGRLVVAHRVDGSFAEVRDLLLDCAETLDRPDVLRRARQLARREPSTDEVAAWVEGSGFRTVTARTHVVPFRFRSAREMTRDPALRFELGAEWRRVVGGGDAGDRVLDAVEDALDVYLAGAGPTLELRIAIVAAERV